MGRGALAEAELRAIDEEVGRTIEAAVRFAEESRPPAPSALTTDVYAR